MYPDDCATELLELSPFVTKEQLLHAMGVPLGQPIKPRLESYIAELLPSVHETAKPKIAWARASIDKAKIAFAHSLRIRRYLQGAEQCVFVAGTAGREWEREIQSAADPMQAYLRSCAATALARNSLEQARRELQQRHAGLQIADSLSPGTDGLNLKHQKVFSTLGLLETIGIEYDEESVAMTPLASVTAIVAIGQSVVQPAAVSDCGIPTPRCHSCPDRNCQLRVLPYGNRLTMRAS